MLSIEKPWKLKRVEPERKSHGEPKEPRRCPRLPPRVPRVARLMALAIRFDELLRSGAVSDQAELAELGQVSRPRVTQIMNLLALAPEIQEELLFMERAGVGREEVTERSLRELLGEVSWAAQRVRWPGIVSTD